MYCYCRRCYPSKVLSRRVVKDHLQDDLDHLASGNHTDTYIQQIIAGVDKTRLSLADSDAGQCILLS